MKRASYRAAVEWIAENFESGNGDDVQTISEYTATAMCADLFGTDVARVARDVFRYRTKHDLPTLGSIDDAIES